MSERTLRSVSKIQTVPAAELPNGSEAWPKFKKRRTAAASGDEYDLSRAEIREYAAGKPWIWPGRPIVFMCDVHADVEAFRLSLAASGAVELIGSGETDYRLTEFGRRAKFVMGGDYLDKGPANLPLLRSLGGLSEIGADIEILAGNHDVRTLVGLTYVGEKDPKLSHLFVRMGRKAMTLIHEIFVGYVRNSVNYVSEADAKRILYPDERWFEAFPKAAKDSVPAPKLAKELARIREKMVELEERVREFDMTLGQVLATVEKARELFVGPKGEFSWLFRRMQLSYRAGSFMFLHAGVDDVVAQMLRREGVSALNARFRHLLGSDLFELYHGSVGNCFRTKYRDVDYPLTDSGISDLHRAGIYAIVHGHKNILRGQRVQLRKRILNFECDASIDRNTRIVEKLEGPGGAALVFEPEGRILGVSTDYPYIKTFDANDLFETYMVVGCEDDVVSDVG